MSSPLITTFAAMFSGYSSAVARFETVASSRDAEQAFIPLFEALNWAVALDDRTAKHWVPEGVPLGRRWPERVAGANVMSGVRFVRNLAHHQWSDALRLADGHRRYPRRYPMVYFEWVWRPADELPTGKPFPRGEQLYQKRLEDRPARETLLDLGEAFGFLRRVLESHSLRTAT